MRFLPFRHKRRSAWFLAAMFVACQLMGWTWALAQSRVVGSTHSLPRNIVKTLEFVAHQAGIDALKITSAERSVAKQAQLMFAMMQCKGRRCEGVAQVRSDYCAIAGRAINDFQNDPDWNDAKSGQAAFERALDRQLRKADRNRSCLMHVVGPGTAPKNFAVDIASTALSMKQRCALIAALRRQPSVDKHRLFVPFDMAAECPGTNALGTERAIHVEFAR